MKTYTLPCTYIMTIPVNDYLATLEQIEQLDQENKELKEALAELALNSTTLIFSQKTTDLLTKLNIKIVARY